MAHKQRGRITATLLATAAIGATAAVWMRASTLRTGTLAIVAPRLERTIDARLSASFPWVPQKWPTPRERTERLSRVIAETTDATDAVSLHAEGLAHLLAGDDDAALTLLRRAARVHPTPQTQSDYAAALITASVAEARPDYLVEALAAVDHALELDRRFPPALFNRAVVIEKLCLRQPAANAWGEYLHVDSDSQWGGEARRRRSDTAWTPAPNAATRQRIAELAFRKDDRESLQRFVEEFRGYSYGFVEGPILSAWADASAQGNHAEARMQLAYARAIAKELLSLTGDSFLSDTVSLINASSGEVRQHLIEGHVAYGKGRRALRDGRTAEAERLLRLATTHFQRTGSPMTYGAQAWMAETIRSQGRGTEGRQILRTLRTGAAARHPMFQAMLQRHLGRSEMLDGHWSAAFVALRQAAGNYAALGDRTSEAGLHNAIANAYASIGNRRLSWQERMVALRMDPDLFAISQAARYETLSNRPDIGLSLLELGASLDSHSASSFEVHRARASMWSRRGDHERASKALEQARAVVRRPNDLSTLLIFACWLKVTEAEIIADNDPTRALQLLDAARTEPQIQQFERGELFPQLELQRARALRRLERPEEAINALLSGIKAVESRRTYVIEEEMRTSVLDFAQPLFRELVDTLASIGATDRAFEYADRWRARTLLDSLAVGENPPTENTPTLPQLRASLPPQAAVLQYVILEKRLLIFCITSTGAELASVPISEDRLRDTVDTFTRSLHRSAGIAEVKTSAAAARDILISPIESALRGVTTVVFVPDGFLQRMPFAALYDRSNERFLVEQYSSSVSPSAQLVVALQSRAPRGAIQDVLVIGNPDTHGALGTLAAAEREARSVASLYPVRSIALGPEATRERFLSEWGMSRIVHFAGHAANARENASTTSLALSGFDDASFVSVHDILRLSRWGKYHDINPASIGLDNVEESLFLDPPEPPATRLVVLAACETFAGRDEHLEGTPTLAHAFLAAGVPMVVGTLWEIDDESASTLFTMFHRDVAEGTKVGNALRRAQLAMLHGADLSQSHPAAWAGVTLAGVPMLAVAVSTADAKRHSRHEAAVR